MGSRVTHQKVQNLESAVFSSEKLRHYRLFVHSYRKDALSYDFILITLVIK